MFNLLPRRRQQELLQSDQWPSFQRMFQDFFEGSLQSFPVDIKESNGRYELEADLPGVDRDSISIELEDEHLTIRVHSDETQEEKGDQYIRRERMLRSCQRSFFVGGVQEDQVDASFENGVLRVSFPKAQSAGGRQKQIPIN